MPIERTYLVDADEIRRELRISIQRARDLMRDGTLPNCFKPGRKWLMLRREFEKWCEREARKGGTA